WNWLHSAANTKRNWRAIRPCSAKWSMRLRKSPRCAAEQELKARAQDLCTSIHARHSTAAPATSSAGRSRQHWGSERLARLARASLRFFPIIAGERDAHTLPHERSAVNLLTLIPTDA